jgi:intracellular septation protein A
MNWRRLEVFLEFLIFGVIMGVIEDLIVVKLSTGEPITWKILGIITLVAIPFAAIGELIVDRIELIPRKKR